MHPIWPHSQHAPVQHSFIGKHRVAVVIVLLMTGAGLLLDFQITNLHLVFVWGPVSATRRLYGRRAG